MGGGVSGGGSGKSGLEVLKTENIKALVVDSVKVRTREYVVEVPKYKSVEQIKYNTKEETTTKFNVSEEKTIKYRPINVDTIKYNPVLQDTTKYIPVAVEIEKPVVVEKVYEKPVVIKKAYTIATIRDMQNVLDLVAIIPKLSQTIAELTIKLNGLKEYKLVEEIVKAPKIIYVPREEERIVWKDVPRERCKECSKEV